MRVIAKRTLRDFWTKHADCEQQLKAWFRETEKAGWKNVNALKKDHPNASILHGNRIVFNIKGNDYRLIAAVAYRFGAVYIKFIGTHKTYDAVDAETVELEQA